MSRRALSRPSGDMNGPQCNARRQASRSVQSRKAPSPGAPRHFASRPGINKDVTSRQFSSLPISGDGPANGNSDASPDAHRTGVGTGEDEKPAQLVVPGGECGPCKPFTILPARHWAARAERHNRLRRSLEGRTALREGALLARQVVLPKILPILSLRFRTPCPTLRGAIISSGPIVSVCVPRSKTLSTYPRVKPCHNLILNSSKP